MALLVFGLPHIWGLPTSGSKRSVLVSVMITATIGGGSGSSATECGGH
jgi:hypothetical protein